MPSETRSVRSEQSLVQAGRALGDGVEHRLDGRRGAGDDLEDVGGRRLLLQRLAHLGMGLGSARFFSCSSVKRRTFSMAMTA